MRNITNEIRNARSQNIMWSLNEFYIVIEKLLNYPFEVDIPDEQVNWSEIIRNHELIGYIWKKYPLIFITKEYSKKIESYLIEHPWITFIAVDSLINIELTIDVKEFTDVIGWFPNTHAFSAEDLWFHSQT